MKDFFLEFLKDEYSLKIYNKSLIYIVMKLKKLKEVLY